MKVLLFTGLGALFFTYYWADNFDPSVRELPELGAPKVFYIAADMASHEVPEHRVQFALDKLGGLDYLVLNHLGAAPAGTWTRSVHRTSWLMQVLRHSSALPPSLPGELPELHATDSLALPSLMDSKGSLVVVSSLLSRVPTSFSNPYSAAKFALDSFFGSLQRELDVQNVNVAITMCILGLRDHASAAEGVRDVTRVKATLGPKAAPVVICGGATRVFHVFCPWRFHMLCLSDLVASLKGLVHSPGAQCHCHCCCLSSWGGAPSSSGGEPFFLPSRRQDTNRGISKRVATTQDSVINTGKEN